jgi:hypothetical protein
MTATATIRSITVRDSARVAALIVVLMIAAILGLVVGTALQGQSSTGAGAEAPAQTEPRAHLYAPIAGAAQAVAPAQTEPRAHLYAPIAGAAQAVAPAQTDPRAHLWAVVDSGDGKATLTAPTPD